MNQALVNRIADAVLYEGYLLYPYRPSVKNRQRWTFGGLYPEAWSARSSADASSSQTQCLVRASEATLLAVRVRFLHLVEREGGAVERRGERDHRRRRRRAARAVRGGGDSDQGARGRGSRRERREPRAGEFAPWGGSREGLS